MEDSKAGLGDEGAVEEVRGETGETGGACRGEVGRETVGGESRRARAGFLRRTRRRAQ